MACAIEIEASSGNVFSDLNISDPDLRQTKVQLAVAINHEIAVRELSPTKAARTLGITKAEVSDLQKYCLKGFSAWQLLTWLAALGKDVDISVRPHRRGVGRITVQVA